MKSCFVKLAHASQNKLYLLTEEQLLKELNKELENFNQRGLRVIVRIYSFFPVEEITKAHIV